MNTKAFYFWSAIFLTFSCLVYSTAFYRSYLSNSSSLNDVVDSLARSEIHAIVLSMRNDLIMGNFSQAQLNFGRASEGSSILAFEVVRSGKEIFRFPNQPTLEGGIYKRIPVDIEFGERGEPWGTINFVVDPSRSNSIKREMAVSYLSMGATLFLVLLGCVLTLLHFFKVVSEHLLNTFSNAVSGKTDLSEKPLSLSNPISIWSKVIDRAFRIGTDYKESRDSLGRLREREAVAKSIAQVAHDLRSPLGALEISLRRLSGGTGPAFEVGSSALSRANGILNQALSGWKLSSGADMTGDPIQVEIKCSACVNTVIAEAISECRLRFEYVSIELENLIVSGTKVSIEPSELQRVAINLINNSIQSASGLRTILVRIQKINEMVRIDFLDDGPGFTLKALKQALEGEYTEKSDGTGLGLKYCRSTIEKNNGVLTIFNRETRGAGITIYLPAAP